MARAATSLPVPVSPVSRTLASLREARVIWCRTFTAARLMPTNSLMEASDSLRATNPDLECFAPRSGFHGHLAVPLRRLRRVPGPDGQHLTELVPRSIGRRQSFLEGQRPADGREGVGHVPDDLLHGVRGPVSVGQTDCGRGGPGEPRVALAMFSRWSMAVRRPARISSSLSEPGIPGWTSPTNPRRLWPALFR